MNLRQVYTSFFKKKGHYMVCNGIKLTKNQMETVIWALEQQQEHLDKELVKCSKSFRGTQLESFDEDLWQKRCENILTSIESVLIFYKKVVK